MAIVNTRQGLKEYALRNLGAPVLEINVDDDQLEDRIDEALEYWRLYHHEGVEKFYLKHQLRASTLTLVDAIADTFEFNNVIVGQTSGARAMVATQIDKKSSGTELLIKQVEGTFVSGETIVTEGVVPVLSAILAQNPLTLNELDNKYIEVDDWIYGVTRMLPFAGTQTSKSIFDLQYQLRLNDLYDLTSTSIIYYKQVMSHLSLLDLELNGKPMFRFNRLQSRLYPDINWEVDVLPGGYVVIECYRALNPAEFPKVYNEPWLKHYVTALFKRSWGTNLKKFQGVQLPGGVTIDGQGLYQESIQEIKELEDELINKQAPLEFFLG
jgi:hypothetical protein